MIDESMHQLDQLLQDVQERRSECDQRNESRVQGNDQHVAFVTLCAESFIEFSCNHVRTDKMEGRLNVI